MFSFMPRALRLCAAAVSLLLAAEGSAQTVGPTIAAGTNPAAIAVNPITNTIYVANDGSNNVTVINGETHATSNIAVGSRPLWIAVNPETNKIYVSNFATPSLSIINGATGAVTSTLNVGDVGWTAINPVTNKAYVLRYGGGDEVNIVHDETYVNTAATRSYQPIGIALNPVTNVLYIPHFATGDIVALDVSVDSYYPTRLCPNGTGGFTPSPGQFDPDPGACINVPDKPVAVTVNPVTNKIYALSSSPTQQISVINGVGQPNPHTFTSLTPPGVSGGKAIAVNPVTNKIYVAFANHVVVLNGSDNTMTIIPSNGPVAIGINAFTNKIYIPNADGTLTVINGDTNAASTITIPVGALAVAVNPVTNTIYVLTSSGVTPIDGAATDTVHAVPLTTTITPLAGNTSGPSGSITLNASGSFAEPALSAVRKVYYQLDSVDGAWRTATGSGPYTASFTGLALGGHTLYAFASNGLDAPSIMTDMQNNPIVGNLASYNFTVTAAAAAPKASLSTSNLQFNGHSMGTTSPAMTVTVTNSGNAPLTISNISSSSGQFSRTTDCGTVQPAASCTIDVSFSPAIAPGPVNSTNPASGTLTIESNSVDGTATVSLAGVGEKSLITHYYRSILRRLPDDSGKAFWQNEASRLVQIGTDVNEAWYALAMAFFTSSEYATFGRSDSGFLLDLYKTFFNRLPDSSGNAYYLQQLADGMAREAVIASFTFSPESSNFTRAIFGNTSTRAEAAMVMDFYRGILGRLPDADGYDYYVGRFRQAQCRGANDVFAEVEVMSRGFMNSPEYLGHSRSNGRYVADLYNAFLRRGADMDGFKFWVHELDTGARSREKARLDFESSPEFTGRINAVVSQGCIS